MIHLVYSVRDLKAEAYLQPFFSTNNGTACRSFMESVQKPESPFYKHPADFCLFHLGTFDDVSGKLEPAMLTNLGLASDYLNK